MFVTFIVSIYRMIEERKVYVFLFKVFCGENSTLKSICYSRLRTLPLIIFKLEEPQPQFHLPDCLSLQWLITL